MAATAVLAVMSWPSDWLLPSSGELVSAVWAGPQDDEVLRQSRVEVMADDVLAPWPDGGGDGGDNGGAQAGEQAAGARCQWYNGTVVHEPPLCGHFALSRLSSAVVAEATRRALQCAAATATECVLSTEIGFGVPAAFLYDAEKGMRVVVAPRPLGLASPQEEASGASGASGPSGATEVELRVIDPAEQAAGWRLAASRHFFAEFMSPPSRSLHTELFVNESAFCVQLLRHAVSNACWKKLD